MIVQRVNTILDAVFAELIMAKAKFPRPFASAHEGFGILKEEVDELWREVCGQSAGDQTERKARMRKEAIQVAAMAVQLIEEVCDAEGGLTEPTSIEDAR